MKSLHQDTTLEKTTNRYESIDGLRGIAILLVVFFHLGVFKPTSFSEHLITRFFGVGWIGVDLFFVISGFLITSILLREKNDPHFFLNFYIRRALRILPLHILFCALTLVLLPRTGLRFGTDGVKSELLKWPFFLFFSNFYFALRQTWISPILDPHWSLSLEEQFYLFWPFVIRIVPQKKVGVFCIWLLVIAFLCRLALQVWQFGPIWSYILPFCRMDSLAAGSLVAVQKLFRRKPNLRLLKYNIFLLVLIIALLVIFNLGNLHPLVQTFGYSGICLGFSSLLTLYVSQPVNRAIVSASGFERLLNWKPLQSLGQLSYFIYLFHMLIFGFVLRFLFPPEQWPLFGGSRVPAQFLCCLIVLLSTYLAARLSFWLFEEPILRLKRNFYLDSSEKASMGSV